MICVLIIVMTAVNAGNAQLGRGINAPPGDSGQGETIPVVGLRLATVSPGRKPQTIRRAKRPAI